MNSCIKVQLSSTLKENIMTNRSKFFSSLAVLVLGFSVIGNAFASGDGGGNEPPPKPKNRSSAFYCEFVPSLCILTVTSGDGGGNEPPEK